MQKNDLNFPTVAASARVMMFMIMVCLTASATAAGKAEPVSELVIDAGTGRNLFAINIDRARPPASLTKLMTLLLTFDALKEGRLRLSDRLIMTADGERQAPSRLGLARGRSIALKDALNATAVISANDIAVALADRLGGSERQFVGMMKRRAADIGMRHTSFGNATGLSPGAGMTTARDIAKLSQYIIRRYPHRYRLFSTRTIHWDERTRLNHNRLLGKVEGLDGLKTGYTAQAGFNLAASAQRGTKRVIVVVMGSKSAAARDLLVSNLIELGFSLPNYPQALRK